MLLTYYHPVYVFVRSFASIPIQCPAKVIPNISIARYPTLFCSTLPPLAASSQQETLLWFPQAKPCSCFKPNSLQYAWSIIPSLTQRVLPLPLCPSSFRYQWCELQLPTHASLSPTPLHGSSTAAKLRINRPVYSLHASRCYGDGCFMNKFDYLIRGVTITHSEAHPGATLPESAGYSRGPSK